MAGSKKHNASDSNQSMLCFHLFALRNIHCHEITIFERCLEQRTENQGYIGVLIPIESTLCNHRWLKSWLKNSLKLTGKISDSNANKTKMTRDHLKTISYLYSRIMGLGRCENLQ